MIWTHPIVALQRQFSRVTSSVSLIPQLDGLRCLSMLLVLGHHVFAIYLEDTHRLGTQHLPQDWSIIATRSNLVDWGLHLAFGVSIFCVISGFILTIPFARSYAKGLPPPSWGRYLLRRLIRLEPPYILNMLFMFFVLMSPLQQPRVPPFVMHVVFLPHLWASLGYIHELVYGQPSWINGIAWTLEIEIQFYLLLPFFARIFLLRRTALRRSLLFAIVLAAGFFAQFAVPALHSPRLALSVVIQLHFFLAGVLLADLYLDPPHWLCFGPHLADALTLFAALLLIFIVHWVPHFAVVEPFLVAACMFCVFKGIWTGRLFGSPWLTIPGCMSYTIYLYHTFLLHTLMPYSIQLLPHQHALWSDIAVQYGLMLVPVLFISGILFLLTERPFILLSHHVSQRFRRIPTSFAAGA
jgi:peptidoglycan/LPS O-acetylase OafA/YrhL